MPPLRRAAVVRCAPFALFMALLALRGWAGRHAALAWDARWVYAATVAAVGGLLLWWRREYAELARPVWPSAREAALAVAVGLAVFLLWTQLDAPWMRLGEPSAAFVPLDPDGRRQWPLIAVRWVGAALLVPPMEELFWRSFLMRWVQAARFETVVPQQTGVKAIVLSTFVFMLAHTLWLAAVIAGLAYALLYITSGKLWLAVIAHAVTNGVLGAWVVWRGNWQFW